jgi:hypothetical protein
LHPAGASGVGVELAVALALARAAGSGFTLSLRLHATTKTAPSVTHPTNNSRDFSMAETPLNPGTTGTGIRTRS